MNAILENYERTFQYTIPETIEDSIIAVSSRHAYTFMAYFHRNEPNGQEWPSLFIHRYTTLMNGMPLRVRKALEELPIRDLERHIVATSPSYAFWMAVLKMKLTYMIC